MVAACVAAAAGAAIAQKPAETRARMGAFQCLTCAEGGYLEGVRSGSSGRVRRLFGPFKELCVGSYEYVQGEQYMRFQLDGLPWPDEGDWGVKSDSWTASCHPR